MERDREEVDEELILPWSPGDYQNDLMGVGLKLMDSSYTGHHS
jgi:hypothetical protein